MGAMQEKAITIQKLFDLLKSGEDLTKKNPVFIEGWVRTNRSSKSIGFIEVNDGSCFKCIQVVYEEKLANFADATHYLTGACIAVGGNLQKISNYIFIATPASVDVSGEFQDSLTGAFDSL